MNEMFIEAKIENMDVVLDFINEQLADSSPKILNQIGVVVDEIFSNIAHYAYRPDVGGVAVRVAVDGETITLEFEDSGVAFDPLTMDDPDISIPTEKRDLGGLGVFMVKKLMDSVEYRREGNKNILTIKKRMG